MNNNLQKKLGILENCIAVQRNCLHPGTNSLHYMHGMLNGMIFTHSVFTESAPKYESCPKPLTKNNIRHKSCRYKKG